MTIGLWSSKYAPYLHTPRKNGIVATNRSTSPTKTSPATEFARFQHAVRRLKWKLPYLADSHRKATSMIEEHGGLSEEEKRELETMFKLDFYEYYTVLERALVHLLGVWELEVEVLRNDLTHTYHAAILTTLQSPTNPLQPILGTQPVYSHLLAAKQLRNRWKNAEVAGENDSPAPLGAFEIEQMLLTIFGAFEQAEVLARGQLEAYGRSGSGVVNGEVEMVGYVEEMEWEIDVG